MSSLPDGPLESGLREKLLGRTRGDLEVMRAAIDVGDFRTIIGLAHRLVGAAGALGLDALGAQAQALEREGTRGDASSVRVRLVTLGDELVRAARAGR